MDIHCIISIYQLVLSSAVHRGCNGIETGKLVKFSLEIPFVVNCQVEMNFMVFLFNRFNSCLVSVMKISSSCMVSAPPRIL